MGNPKKAAVSESLSADRQPIGAAANGAADLPPYVHESLWGKSLYVVVVGTASRVSDSRVQGIYELRGSPFEDKDVLAIDGPVDCAEISAAAIDFMKSRIAIGVPDDFKFSAYVDDRTFRPYSFFEKPQLECCRPDVNVLPSRIWTFFDSQCHETPRAAYLRTVRADWVQSREATAAATRASLAAEGWIPLRDDHSTAVAVRTLATEYGDVTGVAHVLMEQDRHCALLANHRVDSAGYVQRELSLMHVTVRDAPKEDRPSADTPGGGVVRLDAELDQDQIGSDREDQ